MGVSRTNMSCGETLTLGKSRSKPRSSRNGNRMAWSHGWFATKWPVGSTLSAEEHQRQFNAAIDQSLEQERAVRDDGGP